MSTAFAELMKEIDMRWLIDRYVETIARLTTVDGATIITRDGDVLGFGAKIGHSDSNQRPNNLLVRSPYKLAVKKKPHRVGGMRHQSAAQFAFDQHRSYAIVASQDRRLSILGWDYEDEIVSVDEHAEYYL